MADIESAIVTLKQVRLTSSASEHHEGSPSSVGKTSHPVLKPPTAAPSAEDSTPRLGALLRRRVGAGLRQSVTNMIQMRRLSKALGLSRVGGSSGAGDPSSVNSGQPRPVNMENTYRMVPKDGTQFSAPRVTQVAEAALARRLAGAHYDPSLSKELVAELASLIKDSVKDLGFPRYKIVCHVVVGERLDQGLEMASRCLWSPDTDSWACAKFANDSLFAVATIFGAYFE